MSKLILLAVLLSSCWTQNKILRVACAQIPEDTCCWSIDQPDNKFVKRAQDLYWNDSLRYSVQLDSYNAQEQWYIYEIYPYRWQDPARKIAVDFKQHSIAILDWNFRPVKHLTHDTE